MNSSEQSRKSNSSKDALQQKKLEYFGVTSNFIQEKGKGKSTETYIGISVLITFVSICKVRFY
jgi:hypothetical protein